MSERVPSIAEVERSVQLFIYSLPMTASLDGPTHDTMDDALAVLRAVRPLLRKARRQHDGEDIGWTFDDANLLDALLAAEPGERGGAT